MAQHAASLLDSFDLKKPAFRDLRDHSQTFINRFIIREGFPNVRL
jgi:hypothetical protein